MNLDLPPLRSSLWYLCGLMFIQLACVQHKIIQPVSNPMDAAWSRIRGGISELENRHANEQDWRKASEPGPQVVSTISALRDQIKGLNIADSEREAISTAFRQSSWVVHFGFECNYHALVFFNEAGKCWKVIKW